MERSTALLILSDVHYGKRTSTYCCHETFHRLDALNDTLGHLRETLCAYDFDELVIAMLGDIVDGAAIYPTQAHHQEETSATKQVLEFTEYMVRFLSGQCRHWGKVRVEAVPGNHGRSGLITAEADNWDMMAYELMALANRDSRVTVNRAVEGDPFLRTFPIYGHRYLQYHGAAIQMYQSIPWYSLQQRFLRWSTVECDTPWSVGMVGHFHSCGFWKFNKLSMFCTGTLVSDDDWALQKLGWQSANQWWLVGATPQHPITWQIPVNLVAQTP